MFCNRAAFTERTGIPKTMKTIQTAMNKRVECWLCGYHGNHENCKPARPLQRSLEPLGPEMPKKSRKCLPGPLAPEPRKVSKKSSLGTVGKDSFDTFRRLSGHFPDCSRDFLETFRGSGAGGPGRNFRDFFGISGPKDPRDLCKGRAGSQHENDKKLRESGVQSKESWREIKGQHDEGQQNRESPRRRGFEIPD